MDPLLSRTQTMSRGVLLSSAEPVPAIALILTLTKKLSHCERAIAFLSGVVSIAMNGGELTPESVPPPPPPAAEEEEELDDEDELDDGEPEGSSSSSSGERGFETDPLPLDEENTDKRGGGGGILV